MERRRVEKAERRSDGYEQLELVRILVEKEKCSNWMLHTLTGIPMGSMNGIVKKLNIEFAGTFGESAGTVGKIRRARMTAILREKYADQISRLFGKDAQQNTTD